MKSFYPILNNVYVNCKLPLTLKFKLNHTIERFSGPKIGFSLWEFRQLTTLDLFKVKTVILF